jgi:hypothetical protein
MSKARLVITAVTIEKRPVSEVARGYGVARSWIYALLARYQAEGEAAFEPRSRRPKTSPAAVSPDVAGLITGLRKELAGLAAPDRPTGPDRHTWGSQPSCPTSAGSPTSPITRSPTALTPRS